MSRRAAFWLVGAVFLVAMAFSTAPTPLYTLYQARGAFGDLLLTVIFGIYVAGVMLSLYFAGHLSDTLGRRPVLLGGLALELCSAALFLAWPEVPGLLLARFVSGVGIGALASTATAFLHDLEDAERSELAGVASAVANLGGRGAGSLLAGALAQLLPAPLVTPYLVFVVLLAAAALVVLVLPETMEASSPRPRYRPQRVSLPRGGMAPFLAAGAAGFAVFSVFGFFTSVAPSFVAASLGRESPLAAGITSFAVFGAAALGPVLFARLAAPHSLRLGVLLLAAGLAALTVGADRELLPLFAGGGILMGAGVGLLFRAVVAVAGRLSTPQSRGEVTAALFLVSYAGMVVPVVLLGAALTVLPAPVALYGFAAALLVLAVASGRWMLAHPGTVHSGPRDAA